MLPTGFPLFLGALALAHQARNLIDALADWSARSNERSMGNGSFYLEIATSTYALPKTFAARATIFALVWMPTSFENTHSCTWLFLSF